MSDGTYRILDEPRPGALSNLVVDPVWPLFGFMFGGATFGWAWSIVNAFAVGSPTRNREILVVVAGYAGILALVVGMGVLAGQGDMTRDHAPYALLAITLWKLAVSYQLYALQSRTFELYRYFGGTVRNGFPVALAGYFLRGAAVSATQGAFWVALLL